MALSDPAGDVQLLAMHGWGGDHRAWAPWGSAAARRGWSLNWGERGYGQQVPLEPQWSGTGRRALLVHSMGIHLVPSPVLAAAEAVVLLASFGRFVPPGAPGRRGHLALEAMTRRLRNGDSDGLLKDFLAQAAAPDPEELLPAGPREEGVPPAGQGRLLADLERLSRLTGPPEAFPASAAVLVVEAGDDRIVAPESRRLLVEALPRASHWTLAGVGHSLLRADLLTPVLNWLEAALSTEVSGHG
ncbi:alpha/beta hydrolase [Cyanobium sp. Morenito 9A2]|uniref:alpha/beta hydrolase n=1 Tax=Cyanobium sp. Morenito 9A2 TaxID=2823718 RepID=UPI0020CD9C77|nr:alpha/beta hydrolase [Cyanobium sp. Morenito 9A2]MCP9849159.1 alpha/beta hydrolase [Cyanobium sp. Morenito 9A2]